MWREGLSFWLRGVDITHSMIEYRELFFVLMSPFNRRNINFV